MPETWVVLLEAAREDHAGMDRRDLDRLHDALHPGRSAATLYSPDRYALQVTAEGASPVEVLADVVRRWADSLRHLGLPAWDLVRTEVFTPEDLELELERADLGETSTERPELDQAPVEHDEIGQELLRRAFSDPLTGLLGRHAFGHRLERALAPTGAGRAAAVVCLDIDGFDHVNQAFGGATGDEVLITLAQRLGVLLRPGDVLARLGSDEYGILLEDSTEDAALAVAGRVLDAVGVPMVVAGHDVTLSGSAGVVLARPGESAEVVMANVEAALGAAKAAGGGRPVLYGSDVPHVAQPDHHLLNAGLQDRLAHLQLMQQAAVAANEADTLHQAARVVMRHICAQVGCVAGLLRVSPSPWDVLPEAPLWHMADGGHHPALEKAAEELLAGPDVGLTDRVAATGRPAWKCQSADGEGLESAFAFPVVVGREVVAVLAIFSRTRMEPTDSFLDVLAGIGTQLGRVVERQRAAEALRRSTEQLRESEGRMRKAEGLARLGSWHFDVRTGEGSFSEGAHALYGLDPLAPLDWGAALAAVHPNDQSHIRAALARLMETGEPLAEEVRIFRADGQVRWHQAQAWVIRDGDGVVVAMYGTSQDITEAKLAQEVLRERDRRLTEAQRAARLGWWEIELSSGRLTWSDEMYRLWGWEPGHEVTPEAFLATVQPDDRRRLLEEGARVRETGQPSFVEFRATVADGSERWFRGGAYMLYDDDGTAVKLFGTDQDVTEQKQAEHDLQSAKALYQRIVETTNEGIVMADAEHVVTFINPRMAQILGYSVDEMTGMHASEFLDEEAYALLAGRQRQRRRGISEHYSIHVRTKDGAVVQVLVSASPFMDENGQYAGALAMVTDISAVREAEEIVHSQSLRMQAEEDEDRLGQKPPKG